VAKTFTDTDGDLSRVYRAIFESPEFWADAAYRSKIKTPIELTVSAMRAVGAKTGPHVSLTTTLQALGQPLYRCPPPTGYPERSSAWVNGGALVTRINFGLDLGAGKLAGIRFDRDAVLGSPAPIESGALVDRLAQKLLHAPLSPATRKTLVAELDDDALDEREASPQGDEAKAARGIGLVLGSPEFQKQ